MRCLLHSVIGTLLQLGFSEGKDWAGDGGSTLSALVLCVRLHHQGTTAIQAPSTEVWYEFDGTGVQELLTMLEHCLRHYLCAQPSPEDKPHVPAGSRQLLPWKPLVRHRHAITHTEGSSAKFSLLW